MQVEVRQWLRPWVAVAVPILGAITVITAFTDEMPESHHVYVPIAAAILIGSWAVELLRPNGIGFPLVALTILVNLWLTLEGHISGNYLFTLLALAWSGVMGGRTESLATLALGLVTIGVGIVADASEGQIVWAFWISWTAGLFMVWTMALLLRRQSHLIAELRRLRVQAEQAAVLEERQRLARELHDSVTQSLYGVSLYAEAASRALDAGQLEPAATNVREISVTAREALSEMRLLLYELRPPLLEEHGLAAALHARLQAVEARAGLDVDFSCTGNQRLAADREQELYRIAQEALNNVVKHAQASKLAVRLDLSSGRAVLEINDDGVGFEPALRGGGGYGLRGMRERVERLGGTLELQSAPGQGTRIRVEVPR